MGDGLHEEARRGGVHRDFLAGGVVARNGDVVGHEVDVVDRTLEVIAAAQGDESAQREGESVVARREDELRLAGLLESRAVCLHVVGDGVVDCRLVHGRKPLGRGAAVVDGVHLAGRDQIDRRSILLAPGIARVALRRRRGCEQQGCNQKSERFFHKLKELKKC